MRLFIAIVFLLVPGLVCAEKADPLTEVFVTNSVGIKKYHQEFCVSVNRGFGKVKHSLQDALDKGYVPCQKCRPPEAITHRYQKPDPVADKPMLAKKRPARPGFGDSAADIEKDPDGTAVGHGGSFGMASGESLATGTAVNSQLSAREEIGEYRLISFNVELAGQEAGQDQVAFYFKLANLSNNRNSINLSVAGLNDSDEVMASTTFNCTLAGSATAVCKRVGTVSTQTSVQISRWVAR